MAELNQLLARLTDMVAGQQTTQQQLVAQQQDHQRQFAALQAANQQQAAALAVALEGHGGAGGSLPKFGGKLNEDVFNWVETVERIATAAQWTPAKRRRMAAAALYGAATNWVWIPAPAVPGGAAPNVPPEENCIDWSTAFTEAFRKRYSMDDWKAVVTARIQQPGESAAHYAHNKAKFRHLCPEIVNERTFVGYLISGIRHTQLYWHLHNANLATVADFVAEYGRLEIVANTAPPVVDQLQDELKNVRAEMEELRRIALIVFSRLQSNNHQHRNNVQPTIPDTVLNHSLDYLLPARDAT